jgi:hypothetical protein
MSATTFVPNAYVAATATLAALDNLNATILSYENQTKFSPAAVFNMTTIISSTVASSIYQCLLSGIYAYRYTINNVAQFDTFSNWMQSFL